MGLKMKYVQLHTIRVGVRKFLAVMCAWVVFSPLAFSQISGPTSIPLGPFDLQSSLLVEYAQDDNLYQSAGNQVSTSIATFTPSVELLFDNGVSGFSLGYSLESSTFSGEAASEDYTDQRVDLDAGTLFGEIHRFEATGSYVESHDRQSVDLISVNALDYFEDIQYGIAYTLGAEASIFNVELSAGEFERTYINNRVVTEEFDREESFIGAALMWNYLPNLTFGLSYIDTDIAYVRPQASRDGDEQVTSFNLAWEPSSTLALDVSVGRTDRFTLDGGTNSSDYWDVTMEWQPLSYSTLALFTSSYTDEAETAIGGFTVREEFGFRWTHEWTQRFQTEASYTDSVIGYVVNTQDREDRGEQIELRAAYQFRRWVNLGVFIQEVIRTSTGFSDEFDQQIYGVSALFQI